MHNRAANKLRLQEGKNQVSNKKRIIRQRNTKILATMGPATSTEEIIEQLFCAGVDAFRLNFSHGEHADHKERLAMIRKLEKKFKRTTCVVADMQGPKLRLGTFEEGKIALTKGMTIRLDLDPTPGNESRVCLPHPEVMNALTIGSNILLDDGKVRFKIQEKGDDYLIAEVLSGSKLSDRKGFNIPNVILPIDALTEKDKIDLEAALDMGVDWIAQSFVQTADDVKYAKDLIKGRAALMAKIEKPSALECFSEILEHSDGIMLARGDLGVEIPPEQVPAWQKKIVRMTRGTGKPIIVATQMLESMIENARPTRAEASDVATAVYDGADAVMLSAETAAGAYPLESVEIMDRICRSVEQDELYQKLMAADRPAHIKDPSDAITSSAYHIAQDIGVACIANFTASGSTAQRAARMRPSQPILTLSQHLETTRRLALSYGVHSVHVNVVDSFADAVTMACTYAFNEGLAHKDERLVITAGVPFGMTGTTNSLRIATVGKNLDKSKAS